MKYTEPLMEVVELNVADVICTSGERTLSEADESAGEATWKWDTY